MSDPVQFNDDDLVYVDPDTRRVVGKVEWNRAERPKSMPYVPPESKDDERKNLKRFRKFYPWGTYRSMRRVFKVDGKMKEPEPNRTLEEVLPKALKDAFWND